MPIEVINGQLVVKCVNRLLGDHAMAPGQVTTMIVSQQWHTVTQVVPPAPGVRPRFNPNAGIPVKCCICQVCGYMELYSGVVQSPQVWGPPNG